MDFLELAGQRQSCRSYDKNRPVETEKIEHCIEAVRISPSACNAQPWKLIVIDDPVMKDKVAEAAATLWMGFNNFLKQAPVLIVMVREDPNLTSRLGTILKDKPYTIMDVGIAAAHLCLQAASEGLGTCMLGWFNEDKVKKLLGIPKRKRAELIITIGYPARTDIRKKIRKRKEEICSYNHY